MKLFLLLLLLFNSFVNSNYLNNTNFTNVYYNVPSNGLIKSSHIYPYIGFGCTTEKDRKNYLITSAYNPWKNSNDNYKCGKTTKYVEIMKYNLDSEIFEDNIIIGQANSNYPNAKGDLGSDNVVTCGIDEKYNILYYIASNKYVCSSSYNYDTSIVRINLDDFTFMDRKKFNAFGGRDGFSTSSYYAHKYINFPTTSETLNDGTIWVGFGTVYTGIWRLNISSPEILLIEQFQKKWQETYDENMYSASQQTYTDYFREIEKSFINKDTGLIYFMEDTSYRDAKLIEINRSLPINHVNNTKIIKLNGLNYISDIELDYKRKKIFIVAGALTSELYQYDFNFNKLSLSEACSIDFLKFPTEWGVITNIEVDYEAGFIYAIASTKYLKTGVVKISTKDLSMDISSFNNFGQMFYYNNNKYSYYQSYLYLNITTLDLKNGNLYIYPNEINYRKKYVKVKLSGCNFGMGIIGNKCNICEKGKFSETIGGSCENCQAGFSSNVIETRSCKKCQIGKYTNGVHTIDCINCPAGYFSKIEGSNICKSCPKGKYSIKAGSDDIQNCLDCENGKISEEGKTNCKNCELGKWAKNKESCIVCSEGKYGATINIISDMECKLCPIGKFSNKIGITNVGDCDFCFDGTIGNVEGSKTNNSCIICESGKYKKNNEFCEVCPNGWVSIEKSNECKICPKGKYSNKYKITCIDCPYGKYNDIQGVIGVEKCKICEAGKYSNTSQSISRENCISCPEGKYNTDIGLKQITDCKNCPAGKYKNKNQNPGSVCLNCDNGKFSNINSKICNECHEGKFTNPEYELNTFCDICPKGRYNKLKGKHEISSCIRCLAGKWNDNYGSIDELSCIECDKGLYSETIAAISKQTCKECSAGKYNENKGANSASDCKDCSTGKYSLTGSIDCISCKAGKYTSTMKSVECMDCEVGKYAERENSIICLDCPIRSEQNYYKTSCICSQDTYRLNKTILECDICPKDFICQKNSNIKTIQIKKNLWRSNDTTIKTYKCKNIFACSGGKIKNNTDDLCQEGHSGPLCDVCISGWAKDDGVCLKCPKDQGRSISLTIVIPVISTIIIIFLIKTANPSQNKKEEVNGVVKIFMNYAQVFSLASSFQINWPSLIRYLFERAKEFSSPRVSFYSSDCVIGWSYYDKLLVYLTLPLLYIVTVTIIIAIISFCFCKKKKKKLKRLSSVIERNVFLKRTPTCFNFFIAWEKTAIVVGTFLSWPTILEKTLEVMNCESIGNKYYLVKDVSVECYTTKHYGFLTVAYISLGFYGIGIPLLGFKLLYNHRFRLFDMQSRYDGSTPLSFLFLGYREKRWYYEFIIMGKKASLIIISVFLRRFPRYQIIAASLMVQVSFFLHVFLRPYDIITSYGMICNKLESISLLSLVMTLSTGLFFGTIDSGYQLGTFEDVLIILLILCNGGITLYFFIYFCTLAYKTFRTHVHEYLNDKVDRDNLPCFFKCVGEKYIEKLFKWAEDASPNDYGINLKNEVEKKIFSNYFKEKQSKLEVLNVKIDNVKQRRLSIKLDKLRSEIQIMEKERCWQTIKNNRLYSELKKISEIDNNDISDKEKENLDEIFKLYIKHGIKYNKNMNNLYMKDLENMFNSLDEEKQNEIKLSINELKTCKNEKIIYL